MKAEALLIKLNYNKHEIERLERSQKDILKNPTLTKHEMEELERLGNRIIDLKTDINKLEAEIYFAQQGI